MWMHYLIKNMAVTMTMVETSVIKPKFQVILFRVSEMNFRIST